MYHAGFTIEHDENGFFWRNGIGYGYFDTVEEAKASIDRFNSSGDAVKDKRYFEAREIAKSYL